MNDYIQRLSTFETIQNHLKDIPISAEKVPTAILDTNVLLDIFYWKNEESLKAFQTLIDQGYAFLYADETLWEFADVISRERFALDHDAQLALIETILNHFKRAKITTTSPVKCRDRDDQKFLDLTVSYPNSILVTRDKKVLKTRKRFRKLGHEVLLPSDIKKFLSNKNCA